LTTEWIPQYMDFVAISNALLDPPFVESYSFGYIQEYDDEEGDYYVMHASTYGGVRDDHPGDELVATYAPDMRVRPVLLLRAVWTFLGPVAIPGSAQP
jgi:hypothetical protein